MSSYIIVGAGNFGAATALELTRDEPAAHVTLVDTTPYPNPRAASHDINKIIRPDYADRDYMDLMAEVMPGWRTDPILSQFYHEVGVLRIDSSPFSDRVMENYRDMYAGQTDKIPGRWLTVDEARALAPGVLKDANYDGVDKVFLNPESGWVEAHKALTAIITAAIDAGVKYISTGVERLIIDETQGICTGVVLGDGRELLAAKVVLAAGPYCAPLLATSAPNTTKIHAGDRIVATGAVSFYVKLDGETKNQFDGVAVVKSCEAHTKGESMGMTPDGILKFNCDISFTNMRTHPATGEQMSIPPDSTDETGWTTESFPKKLRERSDKVKKGCYGAAVDGMKVEAYRMCWDSTTPTHDFLISPHPHCSNLFIATGGSFHGFKFLPLIGKWIVKMIRGTLEPPMVERWAWDRDPNDKRAANPTYQIEGDLSDFKD